MIASRGMMFLSVACFEGSALRPVNVPGETDPAKAGSVSLDGQGNPISIISSGVAWEGTALKARFKEIQSYPGSALARNKYRPLRHQAHRSCLRRICFALPLWAETHDTLPNARVDYQGERPTAEPDPP